MTEPSTTLCSFLRLRGIPAGLLAFILWSGCTWTASGQNVVQTFFIPFDEEEVNVALNTIDNFGGRIGNTIRSTVSIVGGITNTVIYYDHWEDGYEQNILAPTQSTTQIWGDNNPANGIPPGFTVDRINEGDIITLINDIPIPRDPSNIYYDARDKLSVTRWVAVSRYLYAPNPGEVLADSAQVYDRSKFGFNFRAPVGVDTGTNQMFEYSSIHVAAGYDSTVVRIDRDADGNFDDVVFLSEGESYVSRFTFAGARIESSKPIQAHLVTGDIGSNYEMRFFELFPDNQWDTNYYTSVHTAGGIQTEVYLHNPNNELIQVTCETRFGSTIVNVPANSTATYMMPTNTGANFYTTNGFRFVPISVTDAGQPISGNQAYDWGNALVPASALTTVTIVPWAPGAGGNPMSSINGNPVWVTAESNTTLYVNLDGNPLTGPLVDPFGRRYNFSTNVTRLQSVRIFDNNDNDQTGMRIYTLNGTRFTTVWGQDPAVAPPGNPYLDMGAAVFPFPTVPAVKEWALYEDLNGDGVVNPGDSIEFTIYVVNVGYSDADNVVVYDSGASNTTYNLGSSRLNGAPIADDTVPPFVTEFPFDEAGFNVGYIPIGWTATVSYVVTINDPFPTNTDGIVNGVYVDNQTQVFVPVPIPGFDMVKSSPTNLFYPNDIIHYTIDIISTANVFQTGVQVNDQLPPTVTYVPGSTRIVVNGPFTGNLRDEFRVLEEYNGTDGSLYWVSDWQEIGEADGPGSGNIRVITDGAAPGSIHMLRVQGSSSSISIGAMRRANLRGFTNAVLNFDYRRDSMESGDTVTVAASANGGSSWTTLMSISGSGTDANYIAVSNLNLNAFLTTNFVLRFLANTSMDTSDRVWFDNVEIIASGVNVTNVGGAPPTLMSNYGIASGQSARITFSAQINGNIAVSQIVNRAFINSFASPSPLEAGVTNYVILPERSRIAGWVRNDINADGNVANTNYAGIPNVPITLFTDPNRDGNPADGVIVASVNTDSNGFFELGFFLSNSYVILQTDLPNWRSTGDSDGGNPNTIALTTFAGLNFTNNVFLDTRLAFISGHVRFDTNSVGDVTNTNYPGIQGVTVTLFTDPNQNGDPSDGWAVSSRVTQVDGSFFFANVNTGYYVLVQTPLPGMVSTADSSPPTDNQIPLYLPGGIDSPGHVFLDTSSGLSIMKSSSPPGIWFPGLQAEYTITIQNTGLFTHVGLDLFDYLGSGLDYMPGSLRISGGGVDYTLVIYTNVGTFSFTPPADVTEVEYLVVGGGGGGGGIGSGGMGGGGGGGAGGYRSNVGGTPFSVSSTQTYTVVVGGGGAPGVGGSSPGGDGGGSQFATISAVGGGGGASFGNNVGRPGGSGGGGRLNSSGSGGAGTAGQGNSGGAGASSGSGAGGGGGATANGQQAPSGIGGWGGSGASNNITGTWQHFSGGGGGGGFGNLGGVGGNGGGGSALSTRGAGENGQPGTGGGGSGATGSSSGDAFNGGAGGSGIVIIRYSTSSFGPPPHILNEYTLGPGQTITVTFTAEVASAVSAVTNRACVTTSIITNGLCTTIVNAVDPSATPDRISGQVRFDADGDGNLSDPDYGIPGVTISLYTDPNGDGNPADGVLLASTVTDLGGYYIFGQLSSGRYVLVKTDLSGYTNTADSVPPNDNRIPVFLPGTVDSRDNDFLAWTLSGLTISKTCSNDGIIIPGEQLVYHIVVSNARSTAAGSVRVVDTLPPGVVYVPESSRVYIDGVLVERNVRDLFDQPTYTNNHGLVAWNGPWIETNDGSPGLPTTGSITITNDFGDLRLRMANLNRNIRRSANIASAGPVTLSYFYRRQSLEQGDFVMVEISTNLTQWVELGRHTWLSGQGSSQSDSAYQFASYDVTPWATTNTTLRFRTAPTGTMNNADIVWFDDVSFDFNFTTAESRAGMPLPTIVSNETLAGHGYISITFTAEVTFADMVINTAIVFTASDSFGLRAFTSNLVGSVVMTQGMIKSQTGELGVQVGWSAYTDDTGEVIKEYDILFIDETQQGFHAGLTSKWALAETIQDRDFNDFGDPDRAPPATLTNRMRFYRASFKGTWGMDRSPRYATREIYVAKPVVLKEGENFISLFMVPDQNRAAWIFGTNVLPAGSTMANSTRIEWYNTTAASEATNVIWLSSAGVWQYAQGGIANDMPLPLHRGFNVITPPGSGDRKIILVGRVPTNTTAQAGHSIPVVAGQNYNIVSYNVPYRIALGQSGLKEAGFAGVSPGRPFNPNESDELRILQKGGGSLTAPIYRILRNANGQFQFWTGGSGVADNLILEPDYALIIYTRKSQTNWTWNVNLPYPAPTLFMTP